MYTKTPLYVAAITATETETKLNDLLGFKKDFDDKYHCTVIFSKKEVQVETRLLDIKDICVPIITGTVNGYKIFESEQYGKSFVLTLECLALLEIHETLMSKYKASFDYEQYIPHITLMYDLPDNIDPNELFKKFDGLEINFNILRYEIFDNKKYEEK